MICWRHRGFPVVIYLAINYLHTDGRRKKPAFLKQTIPGIMCTMMADGDFFDVACDTHNQYKNGNWLEGDVGLEYFDCTAEKLSEQHKIVDQSVLFIIPEISAVTQVGNDLLVTWNKELKSTEGKNIWVRRADQENGTYEVVGILIDNVQYKVVKYNSESTTYDKRTAREVEPGQFFDEYTEQGKTYYYKVFQSTSIQSDPMQGQAPVWELNDLAYEEKDGYVTFHCSPISKAYTYKLNWANQRTGEKFTESYEQAAPQFTILFQVADTCDFWISAVNTVTGKVELESNHLTYVGKAGSSSATRVTGDKNNTSKKPDLRTVSNHQMQNNNDVVVKRSSLSSVKNKKKRSFTAKWKKVPDAKGYQIQYALSKKS